MGGSLNGLVYIGGEKVMSNSWKCALSLEKDGVKCGLICHFASCIRKSSTPLTDLFIKLFDFRNHDKRLSMIRSKILLRKLNREMGW